MEAHEARRESRQVNGVGPTGMTVASNIARLRNARGLTTIQLAKLLEEAGRPITASSITKLELGQRKVDVDDLTVIALVLRVSPTALLLPPSASHQRETGVTGAEEVPLDIAWAWILGERPLHIPEDDDGEAWNDFQTHSRPAGLRNYQSSIDGIVTMPDGTVQVFQVKQRSPKGGPPEKLRANTRRALDALKAKQAEGDPEDPPAG